MRPLKVKPIYRVSELAKLTGMSTRAMARLLRSKGITLTSLNGAPSMVTLVELQRAMPDLFMESIMLARGLIS